MEARETDVLTVEELKAQRERALEETDRAVRERPELARRIQGVLCRCVNLPVDVDDYVRCAAILADYLGEMGPGTLYYEYFYENIHPSRMGRARFFRFECRELLRQLEELEIWRRKRRGLYRVK
jgi:hypothetical protein